MVNMTYLVSGLYDVVAFSCMVIGIYFLYININARLNKLAFMLCTSLSCWCFGAGASLVAATYGDSLIWRRFSDIGVGTFFGFLLHYLIILTENDRFLQKIWAKVILYIPSVIAVYFFAISENITNQIYIMERTPIGWISKSNYSSLLLFFNIYNISYMIIGLFLVFKWKKMSKEEQTKNQANTILISYPIAFIVAILAEIFQILKINSYFNQLAPLVLIIPMFSVCYAIKRHNFMKALFVKEDLIFMEQFRTKITKYLAVMFCVGGVLYALAQYFHDINADFNKVFWFSLLLFLFGFIVRFIQMYLENRDLKILLYSILLSISIPVITLHFMKSAAITVWVFPFIILIAALLFNNTTILTMVTTSMMVTQMYMWIKAPNCVVRVDTSDYFGRIGLMGMAVFLIYYINKVYLVRLSQLSDKIRMQDLLFLISSRSINVNHNNIQEKMDEVLCLFCGYANADRAHIYYKNEEDGMKESQYYCWCNDKNQIDSKLKDIDITTYSWWQTQVKETGMVQIPDVSKLSDEATLEKEFLINQNVKAMLAVPLTSNGIKIGFIRIDFTKDIAKWDEVFIKLLMTVGNIIGESNIKISSEKKLEQMAYYDQLTNIPNRQLFGEYINQTLKTASRSGELFSIIFLNIDGFKMVNDTIGHHHGDRILILISDRLIKCLRKTDFVCRFGGDEFLIMINTVVSNYDIETVVNKIIKQFEEPFIVDEQEFYLTASIGISVFPMDGIDKDTLIKNADIAMYKAKSNGKNRFVFCSQEMKEEMQQTMLVTNNLYHAQEKNEINIVYQPQVSIDSGKIIAVEALARWNHPELGIISPALFIPIAEHTGLINSIGEWILSETCKQNKIWQDKGLPPVRVAVNVSVKQLLKPNFVGNVIKILEETGLEPRYLELEITENIAIQESDYIFNVLSDLKKIGISLAIDDFGVEYSSLNRIKMLPIDRLKIDMHFIRGILNNEKDKVIVDVIIKLAKDLNLKVIAEGVEKVEQLNYLEQKKCDEVQGYYFYQPLSRQELEKALVSM